MNFFSEVFLGSLIKKHILETSKSRNERLYETEVLICQNLCVREGENKAEFFKIYENVRVVR
jgi:hypothetical protein